MIGRLRGVVAEIADEDALIDVGGVGYVVRCGSRTLSRLPPPGGETVLHVETQWGEATGMRLFGFLGRDERRAFILLQAIQGVGPKAALGVLDVLSPAELAGAAARQDKAAVARANGVGPKLAQRIVVELKDKPIVDGPVAGLHAGSVGPAVPTPVGEAMSALMGLGWPELVARRAVDQASLRLGEDAREAELIRAALQDLGK
jgi:Holliday junction DNA helicase RuvA